MNSKGIVAVLVLGSILTCNAHYGIGVKDYAMGSMKCARGLDMITHQALDFVIKLNGEMECGKPESGEYSNRVASTNMKLSHSICNVSDSIQRAQNESDPIKLKCVSESLCEASKVLVELAGDYKQLVANFGQSDFMTNSNVSDAYKMVQEATMKLISTVKNLDPKSHTILSVATEASPLPEAIYRMYEVYADMYQSLENYERKCSLSSDISTIVHSFKQLTWKFLHVISV